MVMLRELERFKQWLRWEEGDIRRGWKTDDEDGRMKDIGKTGEVAGFMKEEGEDDP
jgi:hypothetical protein